MFKIKGGKEITSSREEINEKKEDRKCPDMASEKKCSQMEECTEQGRQEALRE